MGVGDWEEIRPHFERVVFTRSVVEVARRIPADRKSVYNWIHGRCRPSQMAQARIRELVQESRREPQGRSAS